MDETIEARLARLGVTLPAAAAAAANYLPYARHGEVLYISGQLPLTVQGVAWRGRLGESVSMEDGRKAARLCAINILAQAKAALDGDLERIRQVLRITGYVASTPQFHEQHLVVNGASDFLVEALGDRGRHARAAVGMAALPLDAAVEIDAILAVG
ncbi:MAG TPA: RidA family protein [Propylenella sp.]|jgi:enamine deaminase RidA (YjgF/YER057c/UK114 family)